MTVPNKPGIYQGGCRKTGEFGPIYDKIKNKWKHVMLKGEMRFPNGDIWDGVFSDYVYLYKKGRKNDFKFTGKVKRRREKKEKELEGEGKGEEGEGFEVEEGVWNCFSDDFMYHLGVRVS